MHCHWGNRFLLDSKIAHIFCPRPQGKSICILKLLFWYTILSYSLRESFLKINSGYLMYQVTILFHFGEPQKVIFDLVIYYKCVFVTLFVIFYPILKGARIICAVFWQLLWFYFALSDPCQHSLNWINSYFNISSTFHSYFFIKN